jgi:hypothetical protein
MGTLKNQRVAATAQVKEIVIPPTDGEGTKSTNDASEDLAAIAKEKATTLPDVAVEKPSPKPDPEPVPAAAAPQGLTPEQIDALLESKLAAKLAEREAAQKAEAERAAQQAELERLRQENEALKAKVEQDDQQMTNLQAVTGIQGRPPAGASQNFNPQVLAQFTSRTDYQPPRVKQLFEAIEAAPKHSKNYDDQFFSLPDCEAIDGFIANEINEAKVAQGKPFVSVKEFPSLPLYQELEQWAKNQGMFRGPGAPVMEAGVTSADMVGGFLPTLSAMLRYTHRGAYVFWQFPNIAIDHGRNRGDTIQIARYALNAEPTNDSDWQLSGGGVFEDITTESQGTQTGVVEAIIKEYGMGKTGVNANRPYMVPNFVQMYSMLSVLESFQVNIMRNYMQFEDRYIRALWAPTSRKVYNKSDEVELTPTNLVNNSNGTLTAEFLHSLYTYMAAQYIPVFQDGCYGYVGTSYDIQNLRKSMTPVERDGFTQPSNAADLASIVNMLPAVTDVDRITGYRGRWGNFHIFEQNTFGMGAAGTPGAQNVTTGATVATQLFSSGYAFGANTIGRGIGMPMELRSQSGEIVWNRAQKWIWISHESFTAIDVDPTGYSDTSDVPQQLRVIEVRTARKPF